MKQQDIAHIIHILRMDDRGDLYSYLFVEGNLSSMQGLELFICRDRILQECTMIESFNFLKIFIDPTNSRFNLSQDDIIYGIGDILKNFGNGIDAESLPRLLEKDFSMFLSNLGNIQQEKLSMLLEHHIEQKEIRDEIYEKLKYIYQ